MVRIGPNRTGNAIPERPGCRRFPRAGTTFWYKGFERVAGKSVEGGRVALSRSSGSGSRKLGGGFLVVGIAATAGVALAVTATLFLSRDQPRAPATPAPVPAAPSPPQAVAATPPRPTDPIVDLVDRQSRDPTFQADLAGAVELLPEIALQPDEQLARGFKLVSNGFDFQAVPDTATTFRYPLPGQTYKSIILAEFLNAGYLAGKAQSFEVDAAGNKVTLVMWAFTDEAGADRGFRALRDLTGRPSRGSLLAHGRDHDREPAAPAVGGALAPRTAPPQLDLCRPGTVRDQSRHAASQRGHQSPGRTGASLRTEDVGAAAGERRRA